MKELVLKDREVRVFNQDASTDLYYGALDNLHRKYFVMHQSDSFCLMPLEGVTNCFPAYDDPDKNFNQFIGKLLKKGEFKLFEFDDKTELFSWLADNN